MAQEQREAALGVGAWEGLRAKGWDPHFLSIFLVKILSFLVWKMMGEEGDGDFMCTEEYRNTVKRWWEIGKSMKIMKPHGNVHQEWHDLPGKYTNISNSFHLHGGWKRSPKLEMVGSCLHGIWTSTGAAHPKMALQAERATRDKKNRQDEVVAQLKMYVDLQH